jgi:iron complex transport system ATP-binding protein
MKLELRHVTCGYRGKPVLRDLSLSVGAGEMVCILGPNGIGKTTLFKTLLGLLDLQGGEITVDGENVRHWPRRRFASVVGYVPQAHIPPFPFAVLDVVTMGRTAHLGMFASPAREDRRIAEESLETLGIAGLRHRLYTEISGGERQMVLIARALAQRPRFLVMDEPTSHLDYGNQVRVLQKVNHLAELGIGVVMTTHVPNHAFLCSTRVVLIQKQGRFQTGTAEEIITEETLRATYGVNVRLSSVLNSSGNRIRACIPLLSGEADNSPALTLLQSVA